MGITATTKRRSARRARLQDRADTRKASVAHGSRARRAVAAAAAGSALALLGLDAAAQTTQIVPSVSARIDVTDNVDLGPSGNRQTDAVTQITPALSISTQGAHTRLNGTISAPVVIHANGGGSTVNPNVNLAGNTELIRQFLFVDASATVSQQYFSPFGPQPQGLVNATNNRYTAQSYQVSPYIQGEGPNGLSYGLRDGNTWTNASGAPTTTNRAYTNQIIGNVTRAPQPLGWALDYDRTETRFSGQNAWRTEIERASALWQPDPQYQFSASAGYEDDRYTLSSFSGVTYGAGAKWRPNDRTNVDADWEHRFFGTSYHVSVDHRMPLSVWSLSASRDATSTPQQFANLLAGQDVSTMLNQLFASRFTDPTQRQNFVDQFIRDRGLPSALSSPVALYTQQVTLQEQVQATFGLLGARNSVFFTAFRSRNQAIAGTGIESTVAFPGQNDNTQTGVDISWTYRLTPLYSLATSGQLSHAVANESPGGHSNQGSLSVTLSAPLSPLTSTFVGARYQRFSSDLQSGYYEMAAFAGISHVFR